MESNLLVKVWGVISELLIVMFFPWTEEFYIGKTKSKNPSVVKTKFTNYTLIVRKTNFAKHTFSLKIERFNFVRIFKFFQLLCLREPFHR